MTDCAPLRDHGGNLDAAIARFGGAAEDWIDLSTGINPTAYPLPEIAPQSWTALPHRRDRTRLVETAGQAYRTRATVIPFNGAQGAIQAVPFLRSPGQARVLSPTYNEHRAALITGGWQVQDVETSAALAGADLAILVNPNNPDGQSHGPQELKALAREVGLLVIDESFADPLPELSLAPQLSDLGDNIVLLRSFGKFYGLAGLRLGFALANGATAARLAALAGPWPVSGPAIDIACAALGDLGWQDRMVTQLRTDAARLDQMARAEDWALVGGTPLFRTYAVADAQALQDRLASHHIWTRIFPYSRHWIRFGLPPADRWDQLATALTARATFKGP